MSDRVILKGCRFIQGDPKVWLLLIMTHDFASVREHVCFLIFVSQIFIALFVIVSLVTPS